MYRTALACGLLALLAATVPAADKEGDGPLAALQKEVQDAIERAEPSVACILVSRSDAYKQVGAMAPSDVPGRLGGLDGARLREEASKRHDLTRLALLDRLDLANPDLIPESYGSGVVIDGAGLVLTNYHVVRDATKVFVRLPGGKGSYADVHAADPRSDFAVLKLLTPPAGLKALKLGEGEKVKKGQFVLALTNPFAAGARDGSASAELGMVSNLRRRAPGATLPGEDRSKSIEDRTKTLHHFGTLIETRLQLNVGCSGGALLDLKGELIGITSSLAAVTGSDTPAGYAIPLTKPMRGIIDRLRDGKEVEYGFLGIGFKPEAGGVGVKIDNVTPGSPADQRGVPANHYLVKVDDTPIKDTDDLFLAIGAALAGNTVKLQVAATPDGPTREYAVTLVKYHIPGPFIASNRPPAVAGLRVDYASTLLKTNQLTLQAIPKGVVVREVVRNSAADKANVQADRVITKVNGHTVLTPADYYEEVRKGTGPLELTFKDANGAEQTVKLDRR